MQRSHTSQIVAAVIVIAVVGYFVLHRNDGGIPGQSTGGGQVQIVQQSQKDAGTGDGSFYNYVTIRNGGAKLVDFVSVRSTCTNASGTVVGEGYGNVANVAPGEQTVVTVIFLNVDNCTHIASRIGS